MKRALEIILVVSLLGIGFSGNLTYHEFFGAGGPGLSCTPGKPGTVFGYPACVYGLAMYLLIAGTAAAGLAAGGRRERATGIPDAQTA